MFSIALKKQIWHNKPKANYREIVGNSVGHKH